MLCQAVLGSGSYFSHSATITISAGWNRSNRVNANSPQVLRNGVAAVPRPIADSKLAIRNSKRRTRSDFMIPIILPDFFCSRSKLTHNHLVPQKAKAWKTLDYLLEIHSKLFHPNVTISTPPHQTKSWFSAILSGILTRNLYSISGINSLSFIKHAKRSYIL